MKRKKTIAIEDDIFVDIRQRNEGKQYFNFSDWVERAYRVEFLGVEKKQEEIQQKLLDIEGLKAEIQLIKKRDEVFRNSIGSGEKRFLLDVNRRIAEGKEWKPLCNLFNSVFKKDMSLEQFRKNVKFFEGRRK